MEPRTAELVSEGLMRVREVARFLGLSRAAVYQLMDRSQLPWVKLGRSRRIPRAAVIELVADNLVGASRRTAPSS